MLTEMTLHAAAAAAAARLCILTILGGEAARSSMVLPAARLLEVRVHGTLHTRFTVYTQGVGQATQTKTEVCRLETQPIPWATTGARTC